MGIVAAAPATFEPLAPAPAPPPAPPPTAVAEEGAGAVAGADTVFGADLLAPLLASAARAAARLRFLVWYS